MRCSVLPTRPREGADYGSERAENAGIPSFIVSVRARDRGQKVSLNAFSIFRMNACDPLLVRLVHGAGRQAMEVEVFWRSLTAKTVRQIDFQSTNAVDTLNAGKFELAAT